MVSKEEFNHWREWIRTESSITPPDILTSNYWQWNCRALLARFMMRDGIYEPALRMMETVVEQIPDEDDHYAWALSDLGCLYWRVHHDKEQALSYLSKSLEVLDTTEQNKEDLGFFSEGGKYLHNKLSIMEQAGEPEKAKEEALSEIKHYQEKYDVKYNSYVFNAYLFLAELAKRGRNLPQAIEYIKKGLVASEYAEKCSQLCENSTDDDDEQLYTKLVELSHSMIVYFEV